MPEYLSAGVFIEERNAGPAVISGVSTSTCATVGWLKRGPVGVATLVTGFDDFVDKFGSYWSNSYVPYAMAAFFSNGGSRAYIVREVPANAVKAACNIEGADQAASVTGWRIPVAGILLTTGVDSDIDLTIDATVDADLDMSGGVTGTYTPTQIADNINTGATGSDPASVVSDPDPLYERIQITSPTGGATSIVDVAAPTDTFDGVPAVFGAPLSDTGADAVERWSVTAENEGAWGNLVKACLVGNDGYRDSTNGGFTKFDLLVSEESVLGAGDYVVQEQLGPFNLTTPGDPDYFTDVVNNKSDLVRVAGLTTPGIPWELTPRTVAAEPQVIGDTVTLAFAGYVLYPEVLRSSFSLTDGVETFTDDGAGTLTGDQGGAGTIDYTTGAWAVTFALAPLAVNITASYKQVAQDSEACCTLTSGSDGTVGLTRALVTDPALQASRRGIYALDQLEEILQVFLPDFSGSVVIANDLIAWAESGADRFIILDPASDLTPQEVLEYRQYVGAYNSSYAALYYPWVTIADPLADSRPMNMPPSAFAAGVMARTDQQRNVGKAPAGINDGRMLLAIGLEYDTSKGERDILYPANINPLMDSPQTGRAVWGARTLSLESQWKYIQVRRLFMFLETSTFLATHWAVFESNNAGLWARISASLNSFMLNLHDEGYFAGETPEESFAVVCDSTNNPQASVDLGLVTCDIYAAPNKPGEFIRFRFQQKINQSA